MFRIIILSLLGGLFTFIFTILGSGIVFFFKKINQNMMDALLSFSAGIMLSAAFFSLLNPAIEQCNIIHQNPFTVIFLGFLFGGLFILVCNRVIKKKSNNNSKFRRCLLLFTSITLHNIPEGLAVGVAFGNMLYGGSLISAITLTLGIAIQNFPEGSAISLPLRRDGYSRSYSFLFGVFSGLVEPISAVLGAILILKVKIILPFILSFAAGAMLYVTVLELIPESQQNKKKDLMAFILLLGFSIMMIMELILG
ncbi:MAG: ZIP family metal transporter [Bacilli bacterium]|nr:ZIP family metal transporter [Bacilli bacterium]